MKFTFSYLENQLKSALDAGYEVIRCIDYVKLKPKLATNKTLVNRVDIDFSVKKAKKMALIFDKLNIKATFFIRLHAPEYNPFSFENYKIIKYLLEKGHEIGYHSEVIDQATIWNESAKDCLIRDIKVINTIFNTSVHGVASHGGMTGLNNLNFWGNYKASDFGLMYEAYDKEPQFNLFYDSLYVSDSEWVKWKAYFRGKLLPNDTRDLSEHVKDNHNVIYLLTHSDTYYNTHFYEDE